MRILKRSSSPSVTGPGRPSPGRGSPVVPDSSPTSPRLLMGGKNSAFKALHPYPKTSDGAKGYIQASDIKNYQLEALKNLQDPSSSFFRSHETFKNYLRSEDHFKYENAFNVKGKTFEHNGRADSIADSEEEEINVNDESDEEKEREYIEMLKRERQRMEMEKEGSRQQPLELTTRDRDKVV